MKQNSHRSRSRPFRIEISLSAKEREAIRYRWKLAANGTYIKFADFIRQIVMEGKVVQRYSPAEIQTLREVSAALDVLADIRTAVIANNDPLIELKVADIQRTINKIIK